MNDNIMKVMNKAKFVVNRSKLKVEKYSPQILVTVGITCMAASTLVACKETPQAIDILEKYARTREVIEDTKDMVERGEITEAEYSKKDYAIDKFRNNVQETVALVKNYAPALALMAAGTACILSSTAIQTKRTLALSTAYASLQNSFNDYRERVKNEVGEEKENDIYYGVETVKVKNPETGKKEEVKVPLKDSCGMPCSPYAVVFDQKNRYWQRNDEMNFGFLKNQQRFANELLHAQGHVFLNDIYKMLGFPDTAAGAVTGWVMNNGDNFIDFGLMDAAGNQGKIGADGNFIGYILDFNVDGVIYDMI